MSLNKVFISGNLTRDPELKVTQGGMAILRIGVAVNERKKQADGNWGDKANFVDCVVFEKRAEALSKILTKGAKVAIEGRLSYSAWEKDGQKRSKLEVIVDQLELMSRKDTGQTPQPQYQQQAPAQYQQQAPSQYQPQPQQQAMQYDTDIPF